MHISDGRGQMLPLEFWKEPDTANVIQEELIDLSIPQPCGDVELALMCDGHYVFFFGWQVILFLLMKLGTKKAEFRDIRETGKQGVPAADSHHLPEVVPVNEISILVYRLCLEHERPGFNKALVVHGPAVEDNVSIVIPDHKFYPGLDDIQRTSWEIVPHFVRGDHTFDCQLFSALNRRGSQKLNGNGWNSRFVPLLLDFRDSDLSFEPLIGQAGLPICIREFEQARHELISPDETMRPMHPIVGGTIIIRCVSSGWVCGLDQWHVTFPTFNGLLRIFAIPGPLAHSPVVKLVLKLNPSHLVNLLIYKLLVTGGTILRFLEHDLR